MNVAPPFRCATPHSIAIFLPPRTPCPRFWHATPRRITKVVCSPRMSPSRETSQLARSVAPLGRSRYTPTIKVSQVLAVLVFCALCASPATAQPPSSDRLNAKSLEAAASFAQSLAQWGFGLIGASLLVLVGTSHRHPVSKRLRAIYFLFLPGWYCLGWSIYLGTQVQGVYLAYLLVPVTTLEEATRRLNEDLGNQTRWMLYGLAFFSVWLFLYLLWWVFSKRDQNTS